MATFARRAADYLVGEALANLVGFGAGIGAHNLMKAFFVRKSVWNLGGALSKRTALDKDTFSALELALTVLVGFVVFELVRLGVGRVVRIWKKRDPAPVHRAQGLNTEKNVTP